VGPDWGAYWVSEQEITWGEMSVSPVSDEGSSVPCIRVYIEEVLLQNIRVSSVSPQSSPASV